MAKEFYTRYGQFGADFEPRVDFARLKKDRLKKAQESLKKFGLGALVAFNEENIRYIIGARGVLTPGKCFRYVVLPAEGDPWFFDLGGELRRTRMSLPEMEADGRIQVSIPVTDGASEAGARAAGKTLQMWADGIKEVLIKYGVQNEKVGFDIFDVSMIEPLTNAGIKFAPGYHALHDAMMIKTNDELHLLMIAAQICDACFYKMQEVIRPGIRECEVWGEICKTAYSLGSDTPTYGILTAGGRTNPYCRLPGTEKIIAPGELVVADIGLTYQAYHTCYTRTMLCPPNKPTSEQKRLYRIAYERLQNAINACQPGNSTMDVIKCFPQAGFEDFSLNIAHGLGIEVHQQPFFVEEFAKLDDPVILQPNMYIALETYEGDPGGTQGVRLEEMLAITEDGHVMFGNYPFDERMLT